MGEYFYGGDIRGMYLLSKCFIYTESTVMFGFSIHFLCHSLL